MSDSGRVLRTERCGRRNLLDAPACAKAEGDPGSRDIGGALGAGRAMSTRAVSEAAIALLLLTPCPAAAAQETGAGDFGLQWSWSTPEGYFGVQGVGDVDGDGSDEFLLSGCTGRCWTLLTRAAVGYRQMATSLRGYPEHLIRMLDLPDIGRSVVVDAGDDWITVTEWIGGARTTRMLPAPGQDLNDLLLIDLDGDGALELVSVDEFTLHVQDWQSGAVLISKPGFGGLDLDQGNIDADVTPEIGLATPYGSCWVLDGLTLAVDWGLPSGCGQVIRFARLTPDSMDEVVSAVASGPLGWTSVVAWDPPASARLFEQGPYPVHAARIVVADLQGDPGDEIVFGGAGGAGAGLWILSGSDGAVLQAVEHEFARELGLGDLDGDGDSELVLTGRHNYDWIPIRLSVLSGADRTVEYTAPWMSLDAGSTGVADLDGDSDLELVALGWSGSAELGPEAVASRWVFPARGGSEPAWYPVEPAFPSSVRLGEIRAGDVDGDGVTDLCATHLTDAYTQVGCYRGGALETIWEAGMPVAAGPTLLANVTGGPELEFLVPRTLANGAPGISALESGDGSPAWTTAGLDPEIATVRLLCFADFAERPGPEILVASWEYRGVVLLDPATGSVISRFSLGEATAMACGDLDGDGRHELVAALRDTNSIARVNVETGVIGTTIVAASDRPTGLAIGDLVGDGAAELVVRLSGWVQVWQGDGAALVWAEAAGPDPSRHIEVVDVDADNRNELVLTEEDQLLVFGRPYAGSVLLIDGFERGDLAEWSRAAR